MDLSTKHSDARAAAARIPALNASLALLNLENPDRAHLDLYDGVRPAAGGTATNLLAAIPVAASAGTVDEENFHLVLTAPIEGQITGADPESGSETTWARIIDGDGDWFADVSVSNEAGSGEVKLATTTLYNGAYCRLISAVFQG